MCRFFCCASIVKLCLSVTLLWEADSSCLSQQHTVHVPLPHNGLCHLNLLVALLLQGLQLDLGFVQTLLQFSTPVTVSLLAQLTV